MKIFFLCVVIHIVHHKFISRFSPKRDIPYAIVTLMTYECLREHWVKKHEKAAWRDMATGAIAGGLGSYVTNPMDVIKTRLQIELGEKILQGNVLNEKGRLKSIVIARDIVSNHGVKGLFAGLIPRLVKIAPASAIMISSYEYCKRHFVLNNNISEK